MFDINALAVLVETGIEAAKQRKLEDVARSAASGVSNLGDLVHDLLTRTLLKTSLQTDSCGR